MRAGGGVGSLSPPGGAFRFAATMAHAPCPAKKPGGIGTDGRLQGRGSADPPNYPVPGDFLILKMRTLVKYEDRRAAGTGHMVKQAALV